MNRIVNPKEYVITRFDGVTESTVYMFSFSNLEKTELKWNISDEETNERGMM